MNLFARPIPEVPPANTRRVFWAFAALLMIGLALRGIACIYTAGILHPDEHQQFLEQAYRMIHGYGKKFWEQDRGMRHPLYQALLAIPLRAMEAAGVDNPFVQSAVIRFLVAVLSLFACACFAWQFQRRGQAWIGLMLMFAFAVGPDLVYVQTHPLSEIAATIPFLLAVCWLDRRPALSGILLGVCFGIRFQMGFLIAATVCLAGLGDCFRPRGPFLRFALAAIASLIGLGIVDWIVFGRLFHSPIEYFNANIVEGVSRQFGEHPWYQYFAWLWEHGGTIILALATLTMIGAVREWKLAILSAVFTAVHIAVAHKESRFLLPIVPFTLAFIVCGLDQLLHSIGQRLRAVATILVMASICSLFIWRISEIEWMPNEGYRSASFLLHEAGRQPDLTGVGVLGIHVATYGNYFFLQHDVPLIGVIDPESPYFQDDPGLTDRRINYLIAPPHHIHVYEKYQPEPLSTRGGWTLYRINRSVS